MTYHKTESTAVRDTLIEKYLYLVRYVAGKMAMSVPPSVEIDDLVSAGVVGLMDAIGKYDPGRDTKFETYAVARIRGAIVDDLRSLDWVPRSVRRKVFRSSVRSRTRRQPRARRDIVTRSGSATTPGWGQKYYRNT